MLQDNESQTDLAARLGWSQSKVSRQLNANQDIEWEELWKGFAERDLQSEFCMSRFYEHGMDRTRKNR